MLCRKIQNYLEQAEKKQTSIEFNLQIVNKSLSELLQIGQKILCGGEIQTGQCRAVVGHLTPHCRFVFLNLHVVKF